MSSDGEVTLLETASYRLVGRWRSIGPEYLDVFLRRRKDDEFVSLDDYRWFASELGATLWGKERQP